MVSKGRKRDDLLRRRPPSRLPKRRILIVCEGSKTEPLYFKALRGDVRNPLVHVEVSPRSGEPLTAVRIAVGARDSADRDAARERDEHLRWDDVWAVVDVDEHAHLPAAKALAIAESIHLAISNPCFELWALLHFQDQTAHVDRREVQSRLSRFMPGYEKELDYDKMRSAHESARKRAIALDDIAEKSGEPGRNPTTGVHRLTEQIRSGRPAGRPDT